MIESIDFNNDERCRTVVRRSNARSTGKYPSWKTELMHQFESVPERNAFRSLDCDPEVLSFREQPCVVRYWIGGVQRMHVPDILVQYRYRRELWEVKTLSDSLSDDVRARTALMEQTLPAHGFSYRLILAEDLASKVKMRNQETLLRFGRTSLTPFARAEMVSWVRATGAVTWADRCVTPHLQDVRAALCRMVLEGVLTFDQSVVINATTIFMLHPENL